MTRLPSFTPARGTGITCRSRELVTTNPRRFLPGRRCDALSIVSGTNPARRIIIGGGTLFSCATAASGQRDTARQTANPGSLGNACKQARGRFTQGRKILSCGVFAHGVNHSEGAGQSAVKE